MSEIHEVERAHRCSLKLCSSSVWGGHVGAEVYVFDLGTWTQFDVSRELVPTTLQMYKRVLHKAN